MSTPDIHAILQTNDGAGRLYATDPTRHDVQIFESDGRFVETWGGYGTDDGQFTNPSAVAVDGDGNVYISEYLGHRIQKFSPDGMALAVWGTALPPIAPGQTARTH